MTNADAVELPATSTGEPSDPALTIRHTFDAGSLLTGTRRGDGTAALLRAAGWRWSSRIITGDLFGAWFVRGSRDRPARHQLIADTAAQLRRAGHDVAIHIDSTPRPMEDAEADLAARTADRAEGLRGYAEHLARQADAKLTEAEQRAARIPTGQPVLLGHHSAPRDLRYRRRIRDLTDQGAQLADAAREVGRRADAADNHLDARYTPETVANRLTGLRSERRRIAQRLDGPGQEQPSTVLTERAIWLDEQIRYWTRVREAQIRSGIATSYTPDQLAAGDLVKRNNTWYPVVRVNRVTVTVPSIVGGTWTDTIRLEHIRDHRRPGDPGWSEAALAAIADARRIGRSDQLHTAYIGLDTSAAPEHEQSNHRPRI